MEFAQVGLVVPVVLLLVSLPLGWILGKFVKALWVNSDKNEWKKQNTIIAEYSAPFNLKPAEIAYLYDKSFGDEELLATLFDLENRKFISLKGQPNSKNINFTIHMHTSPVDKKLSDFEQEVLVTIKSYGHDTSWETLKKESQIWDSSTELKLETGLMHKGFVAVPSPKLTTIKYLFIGSALSATVLYLAYLFVGTNLETYKPDDPYNQLKEGMVWFVMLILWSFGAAVYSLAMYFGISAYYNALDIAKGTLQLNKIWPQLEGFREYLIVVEEDRIKFENELLRESARHHALPYATALNIDTRWQDRFS